MQQRFVTEQWLPFPREVVFAFFANPANLPPLMPRWQRARIDEVTLVPPPEPEEVSVPRLQRAIYAGNGTKLLITARVGPGVPVRMPWVALIEDFRWNLGFCDVQLKGPFAYWRHCHSVRDEMREGRAGTVVRDEVAYRLPLWPVSAIGSPLGDLGMRAMFGYRQRQAEVLVRRFAAVAE